jgi:hypothetical protein
MNDSMFRIGAAGIDVERIVTEVRASVADKTEKGLYTDIRVARAERANLANLKDEENFLSFYLDCLRDAVFVDISDFDIFERRRRLSGLLIALKRLIWKLLKFYTYRLWSQQNQINGLLLSAVEGVDEKYRDTVKSLQCRIEKLESELKTRNAGS